MSQAKKLIHVWDAWDMLMLRLIQTVLGGYELYP